MTPRERELYIKEQQEDAGTSVAIQDTASGSDDQDNYGSTRTAGKESSIRNKYLKKIGVDGGTSSDCEPLLE